MPIGHGGNCPQFDQIAEETAAFECNPVSVTGAMHNEIFMHCVSTQRDPETKVIRMTG
jgi:hypothetical protein